MKDIISKELLSEVWGQEVTKIDKQCTMWDMDVLPFWSFEPERYEGSGKNEKRFCIALEVIAHKCKEWAYKEGWWIDSNLNFVAIGKLGQSMQCRTFNGHDLKLKEIELIFKACQWIL